MTKYLILHEMKDRVLTKKEYNINKCGDCPEVTFGDYCIRKKRFIVPSELYAGCPLNGSD